MYANTQTDTDSLVKPTTEGFAADTILRSVESPQEIYFKLGLPAGASLVQDTNGLVEVLKDGALIGTILPPSAQDGAGRAVPVTMSLSGDTLELSVADHRQEYRWPIEVDPEVLGSDPQLVASGSKHSNWEFYTSNGKAEPSANFASSVEGGILKTYGVDEYKEGELAYWVYQTRGVSKIYEFDGETEASNKEDRIESIVELQHEGVTEEKELLSNEAKGPVEYSRKVFPEPLCPKGKESCVATSGNKENAVHFQQSVVNKPTSKYAFSDELDSGTVYISEPEKTHSTTSYNTSSSEFEIEVENSKREKGKQLRQNALFGSSNWLSEYDGAVQFIAKDPGVGVARSWLEYENAGKWEVVSGSEHNYLEEGLCKGVQCEAEQKEYWTLNPHLPNGEDKIRYISEEAFGQATHETESLATEGVGTVKVDRSKPRHILIRGLPYGNELSEKAYELTAYATDGEGSTVASSGIKSVELYVDGKSIKPIKEGEGTCSAAKGECTASAKYTLQGSELGAGHHAIVIIAKDNAGNEGRGEETISIRHSTPVALGPGSVDLESGDFTLGSTDVSLGSGLSVSRVYSSRDLTAGGEASLLGPQWSLSAGSEESLVELIDGSVLVTSGSGGETIFAAVLNSKGEPTGKFEAPPGDSNLAMTIEENEKTKEKLAYYLKDPAAGTSTKFTPSSAAKVWVPTVQEGPVAADTVTYLYETVEVGGKKVTRPSEERGATPAKVSCAPKMEPGCRALKFTYATKTKSEIGEGPTEWGEYEGHLVKISYEGFNPATGKMTEAPVPVAEYAYDKQGRLRAEWDPRIMPTPLKVEYGYDSEGHVTALDPPGQEPWVFTYGTAVGDSGTGTGRLLKAMRAPVSDGLWNGVGVKNTEAPEITGSPVDGVRLAVSNGQWSGGPLTYGYQWEDCNSEGLDCTRIVGATNANYTPTVSDVGFTLVAQVTGTNGGGSVAATTLASSVVLRVPRMLYNSQVGSMGSGNAQFSEPEGVTVDSKGDIWVADTRNDRVEELNEKGEYIAAFGSNGSGNGQFRDPSDLAVSAKGDIWVSDSQNNRIEEFNEKGEYLAQSGATGHGNGQFIRPIGIAISANGDLWVSDSGDDRIEEFNEQGEYLAQFGSSGSGNGQMNDPWGVAIGRKGDIWVTEVNNRRVEEFNEKGEYLAQVASAQLNTPAGLAIDSKGDVWVADPGESRIEGFNEEGEYLTQSGSRGRGNGEFENPEGVAVTASGEVWVADAHNDRLQKLVREGTTEGEAHTSQSGTTIEYDVPLSGTGAPHNMSAAEVAKWGQTGEEAPVEATAIIPPDSRQGWPATSYTRASIFYMDQEGRVVNTATPSTGTYGTISTAEYNETNDVTRTLSPDNREAALKEGCESESNCASVKKAKLLSTENTYNGEGEKEAEVPEPGTRLMLSRGPEHVVKYVAGEEQYEAGEKPKEATARSLSKYFYDEGAPSENPRTKKKETYDLVTKTESYAELTSEDNNETVDVRTTKTSYSGQDDLGWPLRAQTSVTTNPGSLNLTSTTEYYESGEAMGQVKETRGAGAEGTFTYASKVGEKGAELGKLKGPFGIAIDSKGDFWVVDEGNSRIEEFGPEGKGLQAFGKAGSEPNELKEPKGVAISTTEGKEVIWVAEAGNNRIQEFSTEGKSLQVIGKSGSGTGDLSSPKAVAIDSKGDVWVADTGNNRVEEFGPKGEYLTSFGKAGSETGQLKEPKGIAIDSKGDIWVADTGDDRIEEYGTKGELLSHFGEAGTGAGQFTTPFGLAFDTSGHLWVTDEGNDRVQEFSTAGRFITQVGWKGSEAGELNEPRAVAIDAKGDIWASDYSNNRLEEWSKGPNAHDSKVVYYTLEENKEYAECGKRPEWAGLVCETLPAKQPELAGLPKLPVTTTTYNIWDEPETIVETFPKTTSYGEETRTTKNEYDDAGRLKASEKKSTATTETRDKELPKVTEEYSTTMGVLEKQSTTVGETTKTITSKYNTLGQLETYTDADGNVATFKYAGPENDGLLEEMSDSSDNGDTSQKYTYEVATKNLTKLVDSAAGTFTASYDIEGKLLSEVYPNGMCANYTYNAVSEATRVAYLKTTNCSEKEPAVWYSDERVPSIRGEMMSQTSTLASETYSYDQAGRLTEAQETPAGEYCKTRLYAYDEESDRTSLTTREPNSKKECASEGGTIEAHNYDEASRLSDSGITYDPLGNVTNLPAADAEGHALESTFYVDNAVATQTQNGVTDDYFLDPDGRVRETVAGAKKVISHYDGSGEAVAWTSEGAGETEKWKRNIPGISGALTATEEGEGKTGKTPVLQLEDLQGDVVATITDKTGETELLSKYNSTEFGVPSGGKTPPKFAWLGAGDVESSLASGVITEGATSYVPQTGRALQSEEVAPPGLPNGSGGTAASFTASPWNMQGAERVGAEAPGLEAGREREAMEAADASIRACMESGACGVDPPTFVLESRSGVESLLTNLERGDGVQSTIAALLDTDTANLASFVTSEWLYFFEGSLEQCLTAIGPASHHGGCLLEFKKVEWEGEPIQGLGKVRFELYDGLYNVYSCFKEHQPTEKNLLVCPAGKSWFVFPGR